MRWEYHVHTLHAASLFSAGRVTPREMQAVLNERGNEGWELVSVFPTNGGREGSGLVVLTFKRPLTASGSASAPSH